jgi:hypothetical protein
MMPKSQQARHFLALGLCLLALLGLMAAGQQAPGGEPPPVTASGG